MRKRKKSKARIKLKNISLLILLFIVTIVIFYALGRYTINTENIHIQTAEKFYFQSNILNIESPIYNLKDWDGESQYIINIDLKSYEDAIRKTNIDINYEIEVSTLNENINVNASKDTGILTSQNADDTVQININNQGNAISNGEYITVVVKATSVFPYKKELLATFNIYNTIVNECEISLDDSIGKEWTTLTIKTNNITSQKSLVYDTSKAILDSTNPLFTNYTSITPGNVSLNLESNRIYKLEFIKKNINSILTLGTDIYIQ